MTIYRTCRIGDLHQIAADQQTAGPATAGLIAAERVVGLILVEPGAGSSGFHVAGELVFQSV
jgi:hypothetical protein